MTDICKKKRPGQLILAAVFLGYLIFNGILLSRHEPWRDEANVWLMARELTPLQLLAEIRYQGHPCLWYLLVMPFAKAGLPFGMMGGISYCFMAATAGLFLMKAPFHILTKAALLFSPIFTYYYAEIARNYCLIALFLVLLAIYYPQRNERCVLYGLLLGLLVQSDTVVLMAAGMISLMWLWEALMLCYRQKSAAPFVRILRGLWIPLFSLLFLAVQFYRVSDSPVFQVSSFGAGDLIRETRSYAYWILERLTGRGQGFCLVFFLFSLVFLLAASIKVRNPWAAGVIGAAYLFQAAFSVVVYQLHIWHFIALCFVFIWTVWVFYCQKEERKTEGRGIKGVLLGLEGLLAVIAACMFIQWNSQEESSGLKNALYGLYSDGGNTADYIRENIPQEEVVVSVNVPMASTVLAHLPEYDFFFGGNGYKESYADWSQEQDRQVSFDALLTWAETNFPGKTQFYLLDSGGTCLTDPERLADYQVLYQTGQETARGEEYRIYKIDINGNG